MLFCSLEGAQKRQAEVEAKEGERYTASDASKPGTGEEAVEIGFA